MYILLTFNILFIIQQYFIRENCPSLKVFACKYQYNYTEPPFSVLNNCTVAPEKYNRNVTTVKFQYFN